MTEIEAQRAAAIFMAIANAARIRLIQVMLEGEILVGDLAARIELSRSATSQHLRKFKAAGMIMQRRESQSRHCSISPAWIEILPRVIAIAEADAIPRRKNPARP